MPSIHPCHPCRPCHPCHPSSVQKLIALDRAIRISTPWYRHHFVSPPSTIHNPPSITTITTYYNTTATSQPFHTLPLPIVLAARDLSGASSLVQAGKQASKQLATCNLQLTGVRPRCLDALALIFALFCLSPFVRSSTSARTSALTSFIHSARKTAVSDRPTDRPTDRRPTYSLTCRMLLLVRCCRLRGRGRRCRGVFCYSGENEVSEGSDDGCECRCEGDLNSLWLLLSCVLVGCGVACRVVSCRVACT